MVLLFNSKTDIADDWRDAFAEAAPWLEFRVWPETGPVEEIDYALVWITEPGDLRRYPNLKILFSLGAGVDGLLHDRTLPENVPIVRMVDHGLTAAMTEYVLLHVLRHHRRQPEYEALQRQGAWKQLQCPLPWERRVGILGLGVLGTDAAEKLVSLGFDVAGWSRSPKQVPNVTSFAGEEGLAPFLARTDILVCLLPLTDSTRGILNARTLGLLPRGAVLINAARGGHVVEPDLLAALDSGQIGGATLDVFSKEPLPADHPFWKHPKVTITPHMAAVTSAKTAVPHILDNIRLWNEGKPLRNVLDRAAGY